MKISPQPYSFQFQPEDEFIDSFGILKFGEKYKEFKELEARLRDDEIKLYEKERYEFEEYVRKSNRFAAKVTALEAKEDDYNEQKTRQESVEKLKLDEKVKRLLEIKDEINRACRIAKMVRNCYITGYNPRNRKIKYTDGRGAYRNGVPNDFLNIKEILKADGGIILKLGEEHYYGYDDIIFCGGEICGGTDGRTTYPVLWHAEQTEGFGIFFIQYRPLVQHCRDDEELKKARELRKNKRNIMIITDDYYNVSRFL